MSSAWGVLCDDADAQVLGRITGESSSQGSSTGGVHRARPDVHRSVLFVGSTFRY